MSIKVVGVIGTGVIGASWTGLFLSRGLKVLVSDPAPDAEKKLSEYLDAIWPTLERLGLSAGASLSKYHFVGPSLEKHYSEVDFIQENAPERLDLKTKLIGEIDAKARPGVIIASSSSGIPSSQFISQCKNDTGRVMIGHPFNPPHLMPLVEVVPHANTHTSSIADALKFYRSLGRSPIHIKQEIPGFVVNRLQAVLCNEAFSLVSRGVVSAQDLDACMTTSLGPRWAITGPFLANAMGGGGGTGGFKHVLEHLGPAIQHWMEDMNEKSFNWSKESLDRVSASVEGELEGSDMRHIERKRDQKLVQLLQIMDESSMGTEHE